MDTIDGMIWEESGRVGPNKEKKWRNRMETGVKVLKMNKCVYCVQWCSFLKNSNSNSNSAECLPVMPVPIYYIQLHVYMITSKPHRGH